MSTALTTFDPQVPAYLRNEKMLAISARLGGGLSSGAPPRISIKAARLRTITADGVETLSPENGGTTLDVVVLDANDGISKFYYDHEYNESAEGEDAAPACFSEDGKTPSARASKPQSRLCASCPRNAWGSKISKASGKKVKECNDVKKLAVIPASNLAGDAYMLGIPGASLKAWSALVDSTSKRGVPVTALVIRLGFNPQVSYPQLVFNPVAFMTQEQFNLVSDLIDSPDMGQLVGRGDAPHTGPFVLEQPTPSRTVEVTIGQNGAGAGGVLGQPVPAFLQPQPIGVAPVVPPAGMPMAPHSQQGIAQGQPPVQDAPQPRRRGRPPGPAAQAQQAAPIVVPQAPAPQPVQAAAQVIPAAQVPATDAGMNALLDNIMGGGR